MRFTPEYTAQDVTPKHLFLNRRQLMAGAAALAAGAAEAGVAGAAPPEALAVAALSIPLWPLQVPLEVSALTLVPSLHTKFCMTAAAGAAAGAAAAAGVWAKLANEPQTMADASQTFKVLRI